MIVIIVLLLFATVVMSVRLWCYRQEINYILKQIDFLEQEDTNYRLSSYCRVGKTQELINEINKIQQESRSKFQRLKKENQNYRESISGISHDIRTPLTSAKGYTQMLLSGSITDKIKQRQYIENIAARINDVTDMLDQLFAYARIEADELEFQYEVLNLNNIFADTLSMFYNDFTAKGCEPEVRLCEKPCYIYADRRATTRIIENVIKNALVHGIEAYAFSIEEQEETIEFIASNKTDNIEQEDIERIFDRFYTTDKSRTRKTTGLGLAIVRNFAEKMGGSAHAELKENMFSIRVLFQKANVIQPGFLCTLTKRN